MCTPDNIPHEDGGYCDPDSAMRWDMEEDILDSSNKESSTDDFNDE